MSQALAFPPRAEDRPQIGAIPLGVLSGAVLLGLVVSFGEATFRLRDVGSSNVDWQILFKLGLCGLCGIYGLVHLPRTWKYLGSYPGNLSLLFAVWATLGVPFAIDVPYSAAACGALWCFLLFAPAALLRLGGRATATVIVTALLLFLVGSWLAFYLVPELGRDPYVTAELAGPTRFGGLHHPNGTGRQAALAIALLLVFGTVRAVPWRYLAPLLLFSAVTLVRTGSRTALAGALAATGMALLWRANGLVRAAAICLAVVALAIVIGADSDIDRAMAGISRTGSAEEIYTLTGRTSLWEYVVGRIGQSPVLGYGYGCMRFVTERHSWPTYHAHNSLLNVALGTGVVGGGLVAGMFLAQFLGFVRRSKLFPDMVLLLAVVLGLADTVLFHPIPASHTMIWLIALYWRPLGASVDNNRLRNEPEEA